MSLHQNVWRCFDTNGKTEEAGRERGGNGRGLVVLDVDRLAVLDLVLSFSTRASRQASFAIAVGVVPDVFAARGRDTKVSEVRPQEDPYPSVLIKGARRNTGVVSGTNGVCLVWGRLYFSWHLLIGFLCCSCWSISQIAVAVLR